MKGCLFVLIMSGEFRRYDKVNCSFFDLIDGDLEPRQTMALGYLLSRSEIALKTFLTISGIKMPKFDRYVVDCEAQKKNPGNNNRIDILLRFYRNYAPVHAVIIEAKGVGVSTAASIAGNQGLSYASGFSQLADFDPQIISVVSLTRDAAKHPKGYKSITWSQLISEYFDLISPQNDPTDILKDFVNYITNIKGSMKYYEEEILAIPAGETFDAVMRSGIYECPDHGKYRHKKTLLVAFKEKGGDMNKLYKLEDIYLLDINDHSAVDAVELAHPGFGQRLSTYKSFYKYKGINGYPASNHDTKQVYVLDIQNPIKLPKTVIPMENNVAPAYYCLHEFIGNTNSNVGKIVVQKNIWIGPNNELHVNPGKKNYELTLNGDTLNSFKTEGSYLLSTNNTYLIKVITSKKSTAIKSIKLKYNNNWEFSYNF